MVRTMGNVRTNNIDRGGYFVEGGAILPVVAATADILAATPGCRYPRLTVVLNQSG